MWAALPSHDMPQVWDSLGEKKTSGELRASRAKRKQSRTDGCGTKLNPPRRDISWETDNTEKDKAVAVPPPEDKGAAWARVEDKNAAAGVGPLEKDRGGSAFARNAAQKRHMNVEHPVCR